MSETPPAAAGGSKSGSDGSLSNGSCVDWVELDRYDPGVGADDGARSFYDIVRKRRTVRRFSDRPVPRSVIESVILAAGTAPSGAHKEPWRFVAVSNREIKHKIRVAVEEVEKEFYEDRASERWLADLQPFETLKISFIY